MSSIPKISVVIPTYNGLALLQKHLPFVLKWLRHGDELIIADDASTDESIAWLYEHFHCRTQKLSQTGTSITAGVGRYQTGTRKVRIVVVSNKKNLRFARTCNKAVSVAKNEYILLLNNDVRPATNIVSVLLPYFMKSNNVFGVGCLERNPHELSAVAGKNKLFFARGMFIHNRADDMETGPTGWVSGGSGMFSKDKWLKLGGFDIDFYPAYWEDVDLSYRAKKMGWDVLFDVQAVVDHHHETTNSTVFGQKKIEEMSWKSSQTFVRKHATFVQKIEHLLWSPYWWYQRVLKPIF